MALKQIKHILSAMDPYDPFPQMLLNAMRDRVRKAQNMFIVCT